MISTLKEKIDQMICVSVRRFALTFLLIILAGGGCATAWVVERRLAPTGLAPQDTIGVILSAPLYADEQPSELENKMTGCVQDAIGEIHRNIRIIPPSEIRKLVFPDLTIDQIPSGYFAWQGVLRDPGFHEKIAPLGLRYMLALSTEKGSRLTDVEWTAATSLLGGPGPTLSWSWEDSVLIEAIVVDSSHRRIAGAVHAYATGKSGAGVSLVTFRVPLLLPHGMLSFPFGVACRGLGEALAKFLVGESSEEAPATK